MTRHFKSTLLGCCAAPFLLTTCALPTEPHVRRPRPPYIHPIPPLNKPMTDRGYVLIPPPTNR